MRTARPRTALPAVPVNHSKRRLAAFAFAIFAAVVTPAPALALSSGPAQERGEADQASAALPDDANRAGAAPTAPAEPDDTPTIIIRGPAPPDLPEMVRRDEAGRATMRAARLEGPFEFDGRLDDPIYDRVPGVGGFIQALPLEGEPATEQTEVWVFYDDDTVYIAGRCYDSQPDRMVATEMRRDNFGIFNNENLAVIFDTFYDRRNAFFFYMNPVGGFFDGLIVDERNVNRDWTAVWDSRAQRTEDGWTMEMAIPFKTLRYPGGGPQVWGVNFRRVVRWKNEISYLTKVPAALGPRAITKVSSAGTLVGLDAPASSRTFEVKPYLIGDSAGSFAAEGAFENTFHGDFGGDAKVGITSGLTADLTWNTDFAQVEADAQQVNLTRFSLFFPEKREFFLEGQGIFGFGTSTRAPPAGSTRSFGPPSSTPVLFFSRRIGLSGGLAVPITAGGRVTGKIGDYTLGALAIRTGATDLTADGTGGEPQTDFSVFRLKRDILARSTVGVMGTYRSDSSNGLGRNFAGGVDARFGFFQHLDLRGYAAWTQNELEDRTGLSYLGQLDYNGDRYGLQVERLVVGDRFDPGIGFLRRRDFRRNYAEARFSPRPHSISWLRKIGGTASVDYTTDNENVLETRIFSLRSDVELEHGDSLNLRFARNREVLSEDFALGADLAVPVGAYDFDYARVSYQAGPQRPVSGNFAFQQGGFFDGTRRELAWRGRVEVMPRLTLEPLVSLNWIELPRGDYDTRLLAARVNYTLSPRSFFAAFLQYNTAADSLSTNIRFRWEYQPGSDLFVVYNSQRDTLSPGYPALEERSFIVKFTRLFRF